MENTLNLKLVEFNKGYDHAFIFRKVDNDGYVCFCKVDPEAPNYIPGECDAFNISFPTNLTDAYVWAMGVLACWGNVDITF